MPIPTQTSWVDLIEWDPMTKSGFTVVRAFLSDRGVQFDGDKILIDQLSNGIDGVLISDGLLFLEALNRTFRNPYLFATEMKTGVMPVDFGSVEMSFVPLE